MFDNLTGNWFDHFEAWGIAAWILKAIFDKKFD